MQPEARDIAYLWDMREAARSIIRFVAGATLEEFRTNDLLRYAVERQFILIGEAARRVSAEFKAAHSELPWREMIGQRNVLIHEYGEISAELVWLVATTELPKLVEQLDVLVPPEAEGPD